MPVSFCGRYVGKNEKQKKRKTDDFGRVRTSMRKTSKRNKKTVFFILPTFSVILTFGGVSGPTKAWAFVTVRRSNDTVLLGALARAVVRRAGEFNV